MKEILGYKISVWALFFHMTKQSRYVIESDAETESESFINVLAQYVYKIMSEILSLSRPLPGFTLKLSDRMDIAEYMRRNIDPVVQSRRISPSLLLLSSADYLYSIDFIPIKLLLGDNNIVEEFLSDFIHRALDSEKTKRLGKESSDIVKYIIDPDIIDLKTRKIINDVQTELKDVLDKFYGESEAHGRGHISEVMNKALRLNQKYNLKVDPEEIVLTALLHDIFSNTNRDNHHIEAYQWVMSSMYPRLANKEKRTRIANAIKEHRASYKDAYSSVLSELIATADRGYPDLDKILKRMYIHVKETNSTTRNGYTMYYTDRVLSHKEILEQMVYHLEEKYSRKGYIQYTKLYTIEHGHELEIFLEQVDKIISGKLKIVVSNHNGLAVTAKRK